MKKCEKSDVKYNNSYSFYNYYHYNEKFDNLSTESNYSFLAEFFTDLIKFNKLNP